MKYLSGIFVPVVLCLFLNSCDKLTESPISITGQFKGTPLEKEVKPIIEEASGIADSKANPGYLWVQEDSGRPNQLLLLNHNGQVTKKIILQNSVNRDWEDVVLAGTDLFIGDIGDNNLAYPDYAIYQFAEPVSTTDIVQQIKTIRFQYPDGSHDAEAFLVDPQTKDILLLTKRDDPAKLYKIAYPYNYNGINQATLVGNPKYNGVVSAALSADGQEILLKTYTSLYYYCRQNAETLADALLKDFTNIAYNIEAQGEALAFAQNNKGFFTLSEKGLAPSVNLYFYERK